MLDFGARGWAFLRSSDDPQKFTQLALFDNKVDFDRYWYSPEISDYRTQAQGLYHVPLLPFWQTVEGSGSVIGALHRELEVPFPPHARGDHRHRRGGGARLATPALAAPAPLGHGCSAQNGVRFCAGTSPRARRPTSTACRSTPT